MSVPIPQPPAIPFLGNVTSIDKDVPLNSYILLAKTYGEIYQLNMMGTPIVSINSYALMNEVSDETRFRKHLNPGLFEMRNALGDALFSALPDEPNWVLAHRLLMPAFGPLAIKDMMDGMRDICDQLVLKWERFGPQAVLDPSADFTRLTFDTIALCSMSYRMNSFYSETPVPFITAMVNVLLESDARSRRTRIGQAMHGDAMYWRDIKLMADIAGQIVAEREANPVDKKDLLNTMLHARDPQSGRQMSADSISKNLITFLVAGHETSSGMLTFTIYYLLRTPEALRKLREEVDAILGGRPASADDLPRMSYLNAVLRESLRLSPPAPRRGVTPLQDTTLGGGKYFVKAGTTIAVMSWMVQRDPAVWGEDAEEFRPERHLNGAFEALPPNAWQPFGFGVRACIGRAFAWQEVCLVIATIIQKFDLTFVDPSYTLQLKQTLTVKPTGLHIHARLRTDAPVFDATPEHAFQAKHTSAPPTHKVQGMAARTPVYVLYGSNTGTSEAFAQRIAGAAAEYGFRASLGTLDSARGKLPTDGPVVIVTASFEGQPADNAAQFVDWLRNLTDTKLAGLRFAVFGCGNAEWTATFQAVPKLCDELLAARGGTALVPRGVGDASKADFFQSFDEWESQLWAVLSKEYATSKSTEGAPTLEVKTVDAGQARAETLRHPDASLGRVVENKVLTKDGPVKRHIEFELPEGFTARAGDYLAILPQNPVRDVHRVLARFGLSAEEEVVLTSASPTSLPVGKPVKVWDILMGYVELAQSATTRDLDILAAATTAAPTRAYLETLKASYAEAVLAKRLSVLEILEAHHDIDLAFGAFLQMLPNMRVRQYSISSSPLWNPRHVTLTVSVFAVPMRDALTDEPFLGVGSTYLAKLRPGDRVQMAVRPSAASFHLPADPATPVVMFCAGSGIAPMRGFIQERAAQQATGRTVGKMLLFFGCRMPGQDFLYMDTDLKEWSARGVVDVRPAFSRASAECGGCQYVQDRILKDSADIVHAYRQNAVFFTCGSGSVAKGIKESLVEIIKRADGVDTDEAKDKFEKITKGRYATDIFD
ncbi:fatty acid hydroxylase [Mycena pura]|uniref:Fatty acid hydroxylase n=1 Tax=Mycena pura TaxID=153505 RepID=A0AAD6VGE5_9AGAR|nr:fatty acid hydroxylase [Mycena pura]